MKDGAGLGDAYGVTIERIKAQGEGKANLAVTALTWVCHSERPLKVNELCHALAVEVGAADFDSENIPSIDTLLECCQGLITVDKEASTVRLIHVTVQDYLCAHLDLFSKPHSILAETCLTYLNSQLIKNPSPHPLSFHRNIPFLAYSSRYWGTHANRELSDHGSFLALELLNHYEGHISAVSLLKQVLPSIYIVGTGTSSLFSGLHCASFFGIVELVTILISAGGYEINQQDYVGSTPLSYAARNEHEGVVRLLLEQENVNPDLQDKIGLTPLAWAAARGCEGVAKLLLEHENVDPNRPDKNGLAPLGWAAGRGHEGVVKLLLEREDVDPNRSDKASRTPLVFAALGGHEGVVKLLLGQENVDPNRSGNNGITPLGWAAGQGYEGVVKLLLEREDADPNRRDRTGRTPLECAAIRGHEGVVKLLQGREGVDPRRADNHG